MNKKLSVVLLSAALGLSACGGDSDSSGSSSSSGGAQLDGLSNCNITGNIITVNSIGSSTASRCVVKKPNINNGKKFSLSCQIFGLPNLPGGQTARFSILSESGGDADDVKRDIERNPNGRYAYDCVNNSNLNPSIPTRPTRPSLPNVSPDLNVSKSCSIVGNTVNGFGNEDCRLIGANTNAVISCYSNSLLVNGSFEGISITNTTYTSGRANIGKYSIQCP